MTDENWYSDEALRKQAALARWSESESGSPSLSLLSGIFEPRTPAQPHERCEHCGGDGRDGAGGRKVKGVRWCDLCLGRGHDEDYPEGGTE